MGWDAWRGDLVRLRGVEPEDWETFYRWDRDSEGARLSDRVYPPRSQAAARDWADERARSGTAGDAIFLAIETVEGTLVGCCNTHGLDRRNGTFEYGIAIGEEHRSKGYAREATLLLLRYLFDELGYNKANSTVFAFNLISREFQESLGFTNEGCIRAYIFTGGGYHDVVWYGMTAAEFREKHGGMHRPV